MLRVAPLVPLALLIAALGCQPQEAGNRTASDNGQTAVVANLNGRDIDAAELEGWMKDNLYKREMANKPAGEIYEEQAQAIDAMVNELLVADAAKQAGQTPEAYLEAQALALGPVSDAEVSEFFSANQSRLPAGAKIEELAPRIKAHLESQRPQQVAENLRAKASLTVSLEPPRANVDALGPARGPENAPVVIISFSDYQCPFCKRAEPTIDAVLAKYPTQVRQVYRHLPLDAIHPQARPAAIAAVCAENQGKFWEYHALLFQNQEALGDADLRKHATAAGLDTTKFEACLSSPEAAQRVQADADAARTVGITGTPAFFINGILISGARPLDDFSKWIDRELEAKGQTPPAS